MSDTNLPPATPPSPPAPTPPVPVDPRSAVQGPAIALMILGGVYILYILYLILSSLFGFAVVGMSGGSSTFGWLVSGVGFFLNVGLNVLLALGTFLGGMQMKSLKNYNFAMAGAILAIVPCNYCCCAGVPVGVWALVILLKPEVKAAFSSSKTPGFPV